MSPGVGYSRRRLGAPPARRNRRTPPDDECKIPVGTHHADYSAINVLSCVMVDAQQVVERLEEMGSSLDNVQQKIVNHRGE